MKTVSKTSTGDARLYALARQLAAPVARGWLSWPEAEGAILVAAIRGHRAGTIQRDPIDVAGYASHVLRLHAEQIEANRQAAAGLIRRTLKPLMGIGAPAARLRTAAHECNEVEGGPLQSDEVEEITKLTVWMFLHRDDVEVRHG